MKPRNEIFATLQNGKSNSVFDERFDQVFKEKFQKHGLRFSEPSSTVGTELPRLTGSFGKDNK